jgi:hypothetical protein
MIGSLWGVTFTGYFLVLWALSFFNHWVIGRLSRYPAQLRRASPT